MQLETPAAPGSELYTSLWQWKVLVQKKRSLMKLFKKRKGKANSQDVLRLPGLATSWWRFWNPKKGERWTKEIPNQSYPPVICCRPGSRLTSYDNMLVAPSWADCERRPGTCYTCGQDWCGRCRWPNSQLWKQVDTPLCISYWCHLVANFHISPSFWFWVGRFFRPCGGCLSATLWAPVAKSHRPKPLCCKMWVPRAAVGDWHCGIPVLLRCWDSSVSSYRRRGAQLVGCRTCPCLGNLWTRRMKNMTSRSPSVVRNCSKKSCPTSEWIVHGDVRGRFQEQLKTRVGGLSPVVSVVTVVTACDSNFDMWLLKLEDYSIFRLDKGSRLAQGSAAPLPQWRSAFRLYLGSESRRNESLGLA